MTLLFTQDSAGTCRKYYNYFEDHEYMEQYGSVMIITLPLITSQLFNKLQKLPSCQQIELLQLLPAQTPI